MKLNKVKKQLKISKSKKIFKKSLRVLTGGVNSPVRSFLSVNSHPIVISKGKGCYIYDEDGNKYLDFCNSWGAVILGHSIDPIVNTLKKRILKGTSFGAVTYIEYKLANFIVRQIPCIDQIRFVSSGTEAVMSAIRLARGFTGKDKIIKFEGCYHGHSDSLLVKAGSGLLTLEKDISEASSLGVPKCVVNDTITLPLNNKALLTKTVQEYKDVLAAIIIEPLPANSGLLLQNISFLQKLRSLCTRYKILLIFDEVITGFRLGLGGFSQKYKLEPDIITYGKVIGGGFPVGAFASRTEIMNYLAPIGKVYQAGTLSGNPIAMEAGYTTLKFIKQNRLYDYLEGLAKYMDKLFTEEIIPLFKNREYHIQLVQEASIFWFDIRPKSNRKITRSADGIWSKASTVYEHIHHYLLCSGFYVVPSAYEVGFLSASMKCKHIKRFILALKSFLEDFTFSDI